MSYRQRRGTGTGTVTVGTITFCLMEPEPELVKKSEPELDINLCIDYLHLTFFHSHFKINLLKFIHFFLVKQLTM
jgi:hypothetical protein